MGRAWLVPVPKRAVGNAGEWQGIDADTGVADRNLTLMYPTYDKRSTKIVRTEGKSFTVRQGMRVESKSLGEGKYL
ncbi:hypothetical protein [Laceyella putida]|uniref:Uncharacterized protein n=1 Tax=Laceyella putida TaxID=110101 RepID=A0ABW2RGY5_9BACL